MLKMQYWWLTAHSQEFSPGRLKVDLAFYPLEIGKMRTHIVEGNMLNV